MKLILQMRELDNKEVKSLALRNCRATKQQSWEPEMRACNFSDSFKN